MTHPDISVLENNPGARVNLADIDTLVDDIAYHTLCLTLDPDSVPCENILRLLELAKELAEKANARLISVGERQDSW